MKALSWTQVPLVAQDQQEVERGSVDEKHFHCFVSCMSGSKNSLHFQRAQHLVKKPWFLSVENGI